jgi:hypothetical protein
VKYPVIKNFRDKYTKIRYRIGDIYETEDTKRAEYLQSKRALGGQIAEETTPEAAAEVRQGEAKPEAHPRHVGGGWYVLPDGTRIQGKENAEKALTGGENT